MFVAFSCTFAPLSFYFTRAFQGDALMALGSLAGIYYFWIWTEEDKPWALALSALGTASAALFKPPSLMPASRYSISPIANSALI